jgi:hypothetical protein
MIEGVGTIGVEASQGGLSVVDNARSPRLFKIVSGSNPYTATEVVLDESDGVSDPTGIYDVEAIRKELWEVNGITSVLANTIVAATPNPAGLGFYFTAPAFRPSSGSSSGVTTPGTLFGFDVTDLQCINGVLWVVKRPAYWDPVNGVTYGSAYYSHTAGCCDCPASSGSGTSPPPPPPPPPPIETTCCPFNGLPTTLTLTISGGLGSYPLTWNGISWSNGTIAPPGCGVTFKVELECPSVLFLYTTDSGSLSFDVLSYSRTCDPFVISASGTISGTACDGTYTFTTTV